MLNEAKESEKRVKDDIEKATNTENLEQQLTEGIEHAEEGIKPVLQTAINKIVRPNDISEAEKDELDKKIEKDLNPDDVDRQIEARMQENVGAEIDHSEDDPVEEEEVFVNCKEGIGGDGECPLGCAVGWYTGDDNGECGNQCEVDDSSKCKPPCNEDCTWDSGDDGNQQDTDVGDGTGTVVGLKSKLEMAQGYVQGVLGKIEMLQPDGDFVSADGTDRDRPARTVKQTLEEMSTKDDDEIASGGTSLELFLQML